MAVNERNVWPIANYATFLWDIRGKVDEAEKYYLKALQIDSHHHDAISNYACFLYEVKKNNVEADKFFSEALMYHPKSGI